MASNALDQGNDETEILQFNLTNPEQLTEQLKHAELDDQETDVLLKEALRINAQLKKALRMQQLDETEKPMHGKGRGQVGSPEPLAPRNPRQSTLPPIVSKHDKHGGGNSRHGGKDHKSKSQANGLRTGSASKRKSSANKSRPAWDDRFSFN